MSKASDRIDSSRPRSGARPRRLSRTIAWVLSTRRLGYSPSIIAAFVAAPILTWAADVVVEDWSRYPMGTRGVPPGWATPGWGIAKNDFTIVEEGSIRALHLRSTGDNSTIIKKIDGRVNLKETPILEWRWKVIALPAGADARKRGTDDQAAQLYVAWPRFPPMVRSRIIGYIWDTTAPVGSIIKSQSTETVTYIVLRSGPSELGAWVTERRNVREDFKTAYGTDPGDPGTLCLAIDSNDVQGSAESYVGAIRFRQP